MSALAPLRRITLRLLIESAKRGTTWRAPFSFIAFLASTPVCLGSTTPISSEVGLAAEVDFYQVGVDSLHVQQQSQGPTIGPLSASVSAWVSYAGMYASSSGSILSSWSKTSSGSIEADGTLDKNSNMGPPFNPVHMDLASTPGWKYRFVPDLDGFFRFRYSSTHVGFPNDSWASYRLLWNGVVVRTIQASSVDSVALPTISGQTYEVRLVNQAMSLTGSGGPFHQQQHLSATWSVDAGPGEGCSNGSLLSIISETQGGLAGALVSDDHFGSGITAHADFDGDGRPELIIGAPGDGPDAQGAIYILSLDEEGRVAHEQKVGSSTGWPGNPLGPRELFGMDIAVLGDISSPPDGTVEIAVGAPGSDPPGSGIPGSVYVLSLDADLEVQSFVRISDGSGGLNASLPVDGEFGYAVASVGDVDGDLVPDLAVGAIRSDGTKGAVFLLLINADGTVRSHVRIADGAGGFPDPLASGSLFGDSVAPLGDLDDDGVPDIIISATEALASGPGTAWVVFLRSDGTVRAARKIPHEGSLLAGALEAEATFGSAIAVLGDVNGDGYLDLAVGDSGSDDGFSNAGAVYLTSLDSDGSTLGFQKVSGTGPCFSTVLEEGDTFGEAVCMVPDIDGDGVSDLAIGAANADDGWNNSGAVYLIPLTPSAFSQPAVGVDPKSPHSNGPTAIQSIVPNPIRSETLLSFRLDAPERILVSVVDVSGRRVRTVAERSFETGHHRLAWDGRDESGERLPAGVYLFQLVRSGRTESRLMVLLSQP